MRVSWSLAALFAFSAVVVADTTAVSLTELPTCALLCMEELVSQSSCSLSDTTCVCLNAPLSAQITLCVSQSCTIKESLTTEKYSYTTCGVKARDRTKLVSVTGIVGLVLALIAYGLRMYSKTKTGFGWDDYVLSLSMCMVIPLSCLSVVLADHGLGKDIWNVNFNNITAILKIYFWDELMYLSALPLTKISILCFYLRIFPSKKLRIGVYILIAANIGYMISFVVVSIWQCTPIDMAWYRWDGEHAGHCNNINLQGWLSAALNIILDVFTLSLPLPELYRLKMSSKMKLQILSMFCVGFFVTIVSILRLQTLIQFSNTTNVTQDYVRIGYWSTIEIHVGVICACMPALRVVLSTHFPNAFGSKASQSQSSNSKLNQSSSRKPGFNKSPRIGGDDSFVQLIDMESGKGVKGDY